MTLHQLLEQYYKDYIQSVFLTESELDLLEELVGITFRELECDIPSREQIYTALLSLRSSEPIILPITLSSSDPPSASESYLDMLHSRELIGDQRTVEWKMRRHDYITASVSAACAGLMGAAARDAQLLEKASKGQYSPFKGGYYTDIGNIFEPATNSYYSYINNTRIHDFALIPHNKPEWGFLAASTDGVAQRGTELTNIEIKTLPGRVPDGKIKKPYYHQMQHQMECLGLEHTDFIEVKYEQLTDLSSFASAQASTSNPIGIIAELWSLTDRCHVYEYSPAGSTVSDLERWQKLREPIIREYTDRILLRWIYWVQTHYSCIRVDRDPQWLTDIGPHLKQFHHEMTRLRANQKLVQQMIREREQQKYNRKNANNELFTDCMI